MKQSAQGYGHLRLPFFNNTTASRYDYHSVCEKGHTSWRSPTDPRTVCSSQNIIKPSNAPTAPQGLCRPFTHAMVQDGKIDARFSPLQRCVGPWWSGPSWIDRFGPESSGGQERARGETAAGNRTTDTPVGTLRWGTEEAEWGGTARAFVEDRIQRRRCSNDSSGLGKDGIIWLVDTSSLRVLR